MFSLRFVPDGVVFKEIVKGHLIYVAFALNNSRLRCFNAYIPSRASGKLFFCVLLDALATDDADDGHTVVRGDFNCTLDPALDCKPRRLTAICTAARRPGTETGSARRVVTTASSPVAVLLVPLLLSRQDKPREVRSTGCKRQRG